MKLSLLVLSIFIGVFLNLVDIGQANGKWDQHCVEWLKRLGHSISPGGWKHFLSTLGKNEYVWTEFVKVNRQPNAQPILAIDIVYICNHVNGAPGYRDRAVEELTQWNYRALVDICQYIDMVRNLLLPVQASGGAGEGSSRGAGEGSSRRAGQDPSGK